MPVDLRNPGQFFACCGILYCADRMFKHAEGYFEPGKFFIVADCDGNPVNEVIKKLNEHDVKSMIKADTDNADSQIYLNTIPMRFDFYNHIDNRHKIKLFAGQEKIEKILSRWLEHIRKYDGKSITSFQSFYAIDISTGFDTDTSWDAQDVGFSLNEQKIKRRTYPLVEFFAHVGIQTYAWNKNKQTYTYRTWPVSLPITIARAVASGSIKLSGVKCFQFKTKKNGQKQVLNMSHEVDEMY